jgi:hypothetical protein
VAVAGGDRRGLPEFDETGGVGVYAVGSDADGGANAPGPGVRGRGGRADRTIGVGVVGESGEAVERNGYGVGVFADGSVGIRAQGHGDRAGWFKVTQTRREGSGSGHSAQVLLEPHAAELPAPTPTPVAPTALDMSDKYESELPRDGRAGDLLTLMDRDSSAARLWFCVKGATTAEPANWCEVLLGPSFHGRG